MNFLEQTYIKTPVMLHRHKDQDIFEKTCNLCLNEGKNCDATFRSKELGRDITCTEAVKLLNKHTST